MEPLKIGLFDTSFLHHPRSTVPGNLSEFILWNRTSPLSEAFVCFTNEQIVSENRKLLPPNRRIALLYESRATMKWLYEASEDIVGDFHLFFTHDKKFLDRFENTRWIPGNGIWIGNEYGKGKLGVFKKSRMTSFVTSSKRTTDAQRFRVSLAEELQNSKAHEVDVFLRSIHSFDYLPISDCLSRYRFSIVIENTLSPLYFTEKILNCFAVGTVPIYLGATNIEQFFNIKGIIRFEKRRELLNEILPNLSRDLYDSMASAIEENLQKSDKYSSIEKVIREVLSKEIDLEN